jgi:hypothetical protein
VVRGFGELGEFSLRSKEFSNSFDRGVGKASPDKEKPKAIAKS